MATTILEPTAQKRIDICMEATYQIDALSDALLKASFSNNGDDALPWIVRGIVTRMKELNLAIMAGLGNTDEDESSLLQRVGEFEMAAA